MILLLIILIYFLTSFLQYIGILHPKEILFFHHKSLASSSSSVKFLLIILSLTISFHCSLGFPFLLLNSAFHSNIISWIPLILILFKCPKLFMSFYFYNFNTIILDIHNFSNFQVPNFSFRYFLVFFWQFCLF